ncbi:MAG TPA: YdcF family protein [Terriglobia bacterium]|nr:YdcF family protein [Terriglobia bacterium]
MYLLNFVLFMIPITYFGYQPLLRHCASLIVVEDPIYKSDALLVLAGGEPGRAWGAAELYNQKMADYVIVTKDKPTFEEDELRKRGIELVDGRGNYIRVLRGMGVPDNKIVTIDTPTDHTFEELQRVRELCVERNWKSLIIVTANYHTRRARMAARYIFDRDFQVGVVGTPHGGINPNAWWKSRSDLRTFLIEFEKLVAYTLYIGPRTLARHLWTSRSDTSHSNTLLAFPNSYSMFLS